MITIAQGVPIDRVAEWMRGAAAHLREWPAGRLEEWLTWWGRHGALGIVSNEEEIHAVGVAYPCRIEQVGEKWNEPDPGGKCLYVEAVASVQPQAVIGLFQILNHMVPDWRRRVIFDRRHGRIRQVTLQAIARWGHRTLRPRRRIEWK